MKQNGMTNHSLKSTDQQITQKSRDQIMKFELWNIWISQSELCILLQIEQLAASRIQRS